MYGGVGESVQADDPIASANVGYTTVVLSYVPVSPPVNPLIVIVADPNEHILDVIVNSTTGIGVGVAVAGTGVGVNVAGTGVAVAGTAVGSNVGQAIV